MDKYKLCSLIKQNEGPKLDFKLKLSISTPSEKKELCKDISAIANTWGGRGYIIFGVEDKTKRVFGVEKDNSLEEKIQQIISARVDPPIAIRMEYIEYEGVYVGVLTIFKSAQTPHQIRQNGAFYVRRGSTTDVARRDEIAVFLQQSGMISVEMMPIYNAKISDFDNLLLDRYCKKINLKEPISIQLLESIGACIKIEEKYYPTVGGILVFGLHPQKYLHSASVRIICDFDDNKYIKLFQGNILYILDGVEAHIKDILRYKKYSFDGMCECIRNSIVHRDYFDLNKEIVIYLSKDKVEISNPGNVFASKKCASMYSEKNPYRRNNFIYQRLIILDEENRFFGSGVGFDRIKNEFKNIGKVKFKNIYDKNIFKVILPGIK